MNIRVRPARAAPFVDLNAANVVRGVGIDDATRYPGVRRPAAPDGPCNNQHERLPLHAVREKRESPARTIGQQYVLQRRQRRLHVPC